MTAYIHKIKSFFTTHAKVVENYGFMTFLQIFSTLISLLMYPYLIRTLGSYNYGIYVFAFSVYSYFNVIQAFGFHTPVVRALTTDLTNAAHINRVVSLIYSAKFYLTIASTFLLCLLLLTIPLLHRHWPIILICYSQIIGEAIFPQWYFQAQQKMKIVTFIQLFFKVLSIPIIFLLIQSPDDYVIYAIIVSSTVILSGVFGTAYIFFHENVRFRLYPPTQTKQLFAESFPFFWTSFAVTLKEESISILLGTFFSMKDVALYDLAKKIILIPQLLLINLNKVLFPAVITKISEPLRKRIIRFEALLGLFIIGCIAVFGKLLILLLGGKEMTDAYLLTVLMSFTLIAWVITESYINYVFLPHNRYKYILHNQTLSLTVFIGYVSVCMIYFPHIVYLATALTVVGFVEIGYCVYMSRRLTHTSSKIIP